MFKIFKSKDSWRNQKYPAHVGYAKIGNGLWYEYWNDMSWRPTLRTKIILAFRKTIWKKPTFRSVKRYVLARKLHKQLTKSI